MRSIGIICASPRKKSNSRSISEYLKVGLEQESCKVEIIDLAARWDMADLPNEITPYDMIILVSPLYHDTITCSATMALEEIGASGAGEKDFGLIIHSGYPEPVHRSTAEDICGCFCEKMGWRHLGKLSPGLTSVIAGKDLIDAGDMFKNLRVVLDEAASVWAAGRPVGEKLTWHSQIKPMPSMLLKLVGNFSIRRDAKSKGLDILKQPYQR